MKPLLSTALCAALALSPLAALAETVDGEQLTTSYCAFLSDADHHNSKGTRLTSVGQILRQDRANYHRFGIRDDGDDTDELFMSAKNRALIEKGIVHVTLSEAQKAHIINYETYVCVYADTTPDGDAYLEVTLPE